MEEISRMALLLIKQIFLLSAVCSFGNDHLALAQADLCDESIMLIGLRVFHPLL